MTRLRHWSVPSRRPLLGQVEERLGKIALLARGDDGKRRAVPFVGHGAQFAGRDIVHISLGHRVSSGGLG
jgi:hypothetical protein